MTKNRLILTGLALVFLTVAGIYLSSSNTGNEEATVLEVNSTSTSPVLSANCTFETRETPTHSGLILNEIAWMGSVGNANNEWIELKNISTSTIDAQGWRLLDSGGGVKISLGSGANISAGGFYLLSRGQSSVAGEKADVIYTGALKNSGESLQLFDKECHLVDEVSSDSGWQAGDNTSKKTMERDSSTFQWHTSSTVGGTPKQENTHVSNSANKTQSSNTTQVPSSSAPVLPSKSNINHILISQVQTTGGVGKTVDDFVEIYNPTGAQINLKGYRLVKRTQTGTSDTLIKSWTTDVFIPAYGFYLWANSSFTSILVKPDSVTSGSISDDNGLAIRFGPSDTGTLIDSVAWGKATNAFVEGSVFPTNPGAGQSILRKGWQQGQCLSATFDISAGNGCDSANNATDFGLSSSPTPRNSTSR